jgi:thioredoxin
MRLMPRTILTLLAASLTAQALAFAQPAWAEVITVDDTTYKSEVEQSNKPVMIDFYATWCGPCKIVEPFFDELADEYKNIKFVRVDVDKSPKMAEHYSIEPLPTLLFCSKKATKGFTLTGVQTKEKIKAFIDETAKKL